MRAKIVIAYPCHDRVHAGFCNDLAHLVGSFIGQTMGPVVGCDEYPSLAVNNCSTSILPDGRRILVDFAKKQGGTHMLWLDTDMRIPKEAIHMLMRHGKKIVGANYPTRRPPWRFTAQTLERTMVETNDDSTGLLEVGHVGFGCLLTDLSVFEGDGPWFNFDWERKPEDGGWRPVGEDVFFCRTAREAGHQIYVDQDLSKAIGHIGEFTFTADQMEMADEIAQAGQEAA